VLAGICRAIPGTPAEHDEDYYGVDLTPIHPRSPGSQRTKPNQRIKPLSHGLPLIHVIICTDQNLYIVEGGADKDIAHELQNGQNRKNECIQNL
jgi:hypothetical protein